MYQLARRIGDASARRPWVTIGAWLMGIIVVLATAGSIGGAFVDDMTAPGSQSERANQLLADRFPDAAGGSAMAVFAAEDGQPLFAHREVIADALRRIRAVDHVVAVSDPRAKVQFSDECIPRRTEAASYQ